MPLGLAASAKQAARSWVGWRQGGRAGGLLLLLRRGPTAAGAGCEGDRADRPAGDSGRKHERARFVQQVEIG